MASTLLQAFKSQFDGKPYYHRNQNIGNFVASHLYDDLFELGLSEKLVSGVKQGLNVVNNLNRITGRKGRRGDGTFGEKIPGEQATTEPGFTVKRGPLATLQIGAESKILAKAMIKQIDRVMQDLRGQAATFESQTREAIRFGLVGVNFSETYTSYEGQRSYASETPPRREAPIAIARIEREVQSHYDELVILRFKATNVAPFPFEWVEETQTQREYSAALLRMSRAFEARF
jgi:hypothetical protein